MIDPAARRLVVASALRLHVARRLGTGVVTGDLGAAAATLCGVDDVTRRYGVVCTPAYPGVTAGVEATSGGDRLVLACRAAYGGETVATVLTTLAAGRSPQVTAAPPETPIPADWSPAPWQQ